MYPRIENKNRDLLEKNIVEKNLIESGIAESSTLVLVGKALLIIFKRTKLFIQ